MYTGIINNNKNNKTKRTRLNGTVTPNRHPHHFLLSLTPSCPLFLSLSPMTTSKHNHKDTIPQFTARPTYTSQSAEKKRKCKSTSNETHRSRTQGPQTKKKHGHYYTNGQREDSHMVIFRKHTQQTTKRERERERAKVQRPKARNNLRSINRKLLHENDDDDDEEV